MIRRLDAFDEFSSTPNCGSIRDAIQTEAIEDENQLVAYLRSAPVVLDVLEQLPDVLDGSPIEESGSLCTDGTWYWREDLAHYVEKYHLDLDGDFILHVRHRRFEPVVMTTAELIEATKRVVAHWSQQ